MSSGQDDWEVVVMDDDELNAVDPGLTRRIMARYPDRYINWTGRGLTMSACPHTDNADRCTCGPGCGCPGFEPGGPTMSSEHDHDESAPCGVTCPMVPPDYWRLPNGRWVSQDEYAAFREAGGGRP